MRCDDEVYIMVNPQDLRIFFNSWTQVEYFEPKNLIIDIT